MPASNAGTGMQFLSHNQIEKNKWDDCIRRASNELPYAYSWYLDTMCQNWDAIIWKDYEAVFPLTWNKKAGVYYLYQPFFTQQLGVFSPAKITGEMVQSFLAAVPEKFRFIEINLNSDNFFKGPSFSVKQKLTHHLLLHEPHDNIRSGYNDNAKRNLKKAVKEDLSVRNNISPAQIIAMFRKNQGGRVPEVKSRDYGKLKTLMEISLKNGQGEIIGIQTKAGELCAAGFFIRSARMVINLFPSSSEEGRKNGAMLFLIDSVLKKYEQTGLIFDFEGSEVPSIAKFYKGFGGKEVFYTHIRRNNLPWHLKWLKK